MRILYVITFWFTVALLSCTNKREVHVPAENTAQPKHGNKLVAVTSFNSTNYFIYKGAPMGFQYELLQELSNYLGLNIEVVVSNDLSDNFKRLESNEIDIIASNLTVTADRKKFMQFTTPLGATRQVIVQRSNALGYIDSPLQLAGKRVYVAANTSYIERLSNLSSEIGDTIIVYETNFETEELIEQVAKGKIDFTVCDENIAKVNAQLYDNIDIKTEVSFPQYFAWAVSKDNDTLLHKINAWLVDFKKTNKYKLVYNKYFEQKKHGQQKG
ncbi:MAG: transporter substrate-binding domain-containing protein [Bacteroidales bacterium]|nr:transporter substrate-binding domain-containing protein [Bacteroidales bacterium]